MKSYLWLLVLASCGHRIAVVQPGEPAAAPAGPYSNEIASDEPVAHFRIRGKLADSAIATSDADGARAFRDEAIALVPPREVETDALTVEAWLRVRGTDAELLSFGTAPQGGLAL